MATTNQGTSKQIQRKKELGGSTCKLGRRRKVVVVPSQHINSPVLGGGARVFGPNRDGWLLNKKLKTLACKSAFV